MSFGYVKGFEEKIIESFYIYPLDDESRDLVAEDEAEKLIKKTDCFKSPPKRIGEAWENLAVAIVAQAAIDYVQLLKIRNQSTPYTSKVLKERIAELEDFFCNQSFVPDLDAEALIFKLKEKERNLENV